MKDINDVVHLLKVAIREAEIMGLHMWVNSTWVTCPFASQLLQHVRKELSLYLPETGEVFFLN